MRMGFKVAGWTSGLALAAMLAGSGRGTEVTAAESKATKKTIARLEAPAIAKGIDKHINARLADEKITASPVADDAEILRRVYLDLTGVIPPADKAAEFLGSQDPQKRAKLIDELLNDANYGRRLADIWQDFLIPRVSDNRRLNVEPLYQWLRDSFNENKPWNQMAAELVTASGPQNENGATTFFIANPSADMVTDRVAKLFLGNQLQCAQCHNHPFTGWKQTEYWGMAAFFTQVRTGNVNKAARDGSTISVSESPNGRGGRLPESAKILPPKFLQGDEPQIDKSAPRRPVLAEWMTSPENPYFAKAMVNRMWHHFFGRGIVNPVDDMHEGNPATHPELLQELTDQFVASDFDLKNLVRAICNSETYQRTSRPVAGNESDDKLFSHMALKALSPEQLFDSLTLVVGQRGKEDTRPRKGGNRVNPVGARAQFVAFFQVEEGADPTEYQAGIPQALRLMNSADLNRGAVALNDAIKQGTTPEEVIERLYLATLARKPSAAELERVNAFVKKSDDVKKGYADLLWALLNSSEFALNH